MRLIKGMSRHDQTKIPPPNYLDSANNVLHADDAALAGGATNATGQTACNSHNED